MTARREIPANANGMIDFILINDTPSDNYPSTYDSIESLQTLINEE